MRCNPEIEFTRLQITVNRIYKIVDYSIHKNTHAHYVTFNGYKEGAVIYTNHIPIMFTVNILIAKKYYHIEISP